MRFQTLAALPLLFSTALSYPNSLHSRDTNDEELSLQHRAVAEAYADAYDSAHSAIQARSLNEAGKPSCGGPDGTSTGIADTNTGCYSIPIGESRSGGGNPPDITISEDQTATTTPEEEPGHDGPQFEDSEHNAQPILNNETEEERRPGK